MSDTKFTPGPWHNKSKNSVHVCGPKHLDGGHYAPICIANTEANARLIAAAPDLYAALKKAVEFLDYCGYGDSWERSCAMESKLPQLFETALAKAEGRE